MMSSRMRFTLNGLAVVFAAIGLFAAGAWAQDNVGGSGTPAVVHSGNTDITFEPAGTQGLPEDRYQAFEQFAQSNPPIAKALTRNPRLINSENFVKKNPPLGEFLNAHPEVKSDFAENPGNYVDMPVAVAAELKKQPMESR